MTEATKREAVAAGLLAHSVALIGFGFDSGLELVSAVALFGRLRVELRGGDAEWNAVESLHRSAGEAAPA
jgi:hypothetical protein